MKGSRRDFLRGAAIAGAVPAVGGLSAIASDRSDSSPELRVLAENRARIETFRVDFECRSETPDLLVGRNQLLGSRGLYRLVNVGPEASLVRIVERERILDAVFRDGRLVKAAVRDRRGSALGMTLRTFLPGPADKPFAREKARRVGEERCAGIVQNRHRYWVATRTFRVLGVDVFATADRVGEEVRFDGFREIVPGLPFPSRIDVTRLDRKGTVLSAKRLEVTDAVANEPLDAALFSIDGFLADPERSVTA